MKLRNRILSLLLAAVCMVSVFAPMIPTVSAATTSSVASKVKSRLPLLTYAMPLSGADRVYAYSDSSLSKKTTGWYIDTFDDQIVIRKISSTGVTFLEANLDGRNTVVLKTYTWAKLCSSNAAMSVYTASSYRLK